MAYQKLGSLIRSIDMDAWVRALTRRLDAVSNPHFDWGRFLFTIDDCRFTNEVNALLTRGWKVIYLECPDEVRKERLIKRELGMTYSEAIKEGKEKEVLQLVNRMEHLSEESAKSLLMIGDNCYRINSNRPEEEVWKDVAEIAGVKP